MKSKRILTLLVGLLLVVPVLAWGQGRLGDTLILESKTVVPSLNAPNSVLLKLSITNLDSLTFLTWTCEERSLSGGAYILFNNGPGGTGRTFTNLVNPLTGTLRFNFATSFSAGYNDASPDKFLIAAGFDPADPTTIEPPNATRKAVWELRFKSTTAALGQVIFDTATVSNLRNTFTNTTPQDFPVNYIPGIVTIDIPAVDNPPPGNNVNADPTTNCAGYNFNPSGACPGNFSMVSPLPGPTITPSGDFSWCGQCGGPYPVTIQNDCNGTIVSYTFTATFNPGPPTAVCPPNAQVQAGSVYNGLATATSGVPPYTFSKISGPSGLVVAPSGAIGWGTSVVDVGTHNVTIGVVDACQQTSQCTFTIRVVVGGPFRLCIDTIKAYQGSDVEVSIKNLDDATDPLLANGKSVGGFSFLISYDCACLQFLSARKGALLNQQRWEFFTYRYGAIGNGNCGSGCPSCLIRIVAIADVNNGANHPNLTRDNQGEWAVLKFRTTNDRILAGQCCPISWYWFDCTDNTVSDSTGNTLYVVDSLYTSAGIGVDLANAGFPNDVSNCDQSSGGPGKPSPKKNIIFCNGHICLPTSEEIDARGDLNLNGVGHEVGDAVLYENYFIYGPGVLSSNPTHRQAQIAASDVNGDGLVLSVGDLVALIRVITGDANPLPRPTVATGAVSIALSAAGSNWTLAANSASDLGGLYLKFRVDGSVGTPALSEAAGGMTVKSNLIGNELSVLVYSESKNRIAPNAGAIFTLNVEGSVELIETEAADYYGHALPALTKAAALPTKFGLSQNYPNPFNGRTSFVLALPVASDYTVNVYNVAGQVVRTFEGSAGAGNKTIVWDGTDRNGTAVSSGIYFYKAAAKGFSATMKMLYLK